MPSVQAVLPALERAMLVSEKAKPPGPATFEARWLPWRYEPSRNRSITAATSSGRS